MDVQIYLTAADYPRSNNPFPSDHPQPDLTLTIEVDVCGLDCPAIPPHAAYVTPDYGQLQQLLQEPIAAAVRGALLSDALA